MMDATKLALTRAFDWYEPEMQAGMMKNILKMHATNMLQITHWQNNHVLLFFLLF